MDEKEMKPSRVIGYTVRNLVLLINLQGYDAKDVEQRQRICEDVYNPDRNYLDYASVSFLQSQKSTVYVVIRNQILRQKFNQPLFEKIFETSGGKIIVYRLK